MGKPLFAKRGFLVPFPRKLWVETGKQVHFFILRRIPSCRFAFATPRSPSAFPPIYIFNITSSWSKMHKMSYTNIDSSATDI